MRIVVNKQWRVYLLFGRAGSLSLQLYWTYHRLLHMRVAVNSYALPIYKKNRFASLLSIFETTIFLCYWIYLTRCEKGNETLKKTLIFIFFSNSCNKFNNTWVLCVWIPLCRKRRWKPRFCCMITTTVHSILCICSVWTTHLLFNL